jgi:hypothetical protein
MTRQPKCPKEESHITWSPTYALYKKETISTHPHKTTMLTAAIVCRECQAVYVKGGEGVLCEGWTVYKLDKAQIVKKTRQPVLLRG